jgi:hypothetical protein
MGTLGEKLQAAGFNQFEHQLKTVLLNYFKSGGAEDRLQVLIADAKRMSGMGRVAVAANSGRSDIAQTRQPVEGENGHIAPALEDRKSAVPLSPSSELPGVGQTARADSPDTPAQTRQPIEGERGQTLTALDRAARLVPLSPSSNRGGEGHHVRAKTSGQELPALPVREPVVPNKPRGLTAIASTTSTIQRGLLQLTRTSDGRAWAAIGWHELDGMGRDGAIARLVKARVAPPKDNFAPLISIMTNKQFEEILNDSQKQIEAAV